MRRQKVSDTQSEDDDEYLKQEKHIVGLIDKFRQKKKNNVLTDIKNAFFNYELLLETNYASPAKWTWLAQRKAEVNALKNQKATENQQEVARNLVTKQHVGMIAQQVRNNFLGIDQGLEQAITISTFIKAQLNKQIEDLDRVYDINKDTEVRIKRAMDGLRTMIRRIMMSKITRFLSIVTVLAIIALIVVYVLQSNGIIA